MNVREVHLEGDLKSRRKGRESAATASEPELEEEASALPRRSRVIVICHCPLC